MLDAAVGHDRRRLRQLQHGEAVVALPDAKRNRLAGVPLFGLRPLVGVALPFLARQDAAQLAAQVDAGNLAKAERLHEVVNKVDAHLVGERIEIDVARQLDSAPHVDAAQIAFRAAEAVTGKVVIAGVVHDHVRPTLAGLQGSQCHEGLVGRAGRVRAAQRTVQQWLVERLAQLFPAFGVDAFDEQIGVEGRLADKGQHFAGLRIDRHQSAAPVTEHVFDHLLQLDVERQHHGVAGRRRVARQAPHRPTTCRCLHLLDAGQPV